MLHVRRDIRTFAYSTTENKDQHSSLLIGIVSCDHVQLNQGVVMHVRIIRPLLLPYVTLYREIMVGLCMNAPKEPRPCPVWHCTATSWSGYACTHHKKVALASCDIVQPNHGVLTNVHIIRTFPLRYVTFFGQIMVWLCVCHKKTYPCLMCHCTAESWHGYAFVQYKYLPFGVALCDIGLTNDNQICIILFAMMCTLFPV